MHPRDTPTLARQTVDQGTSRRTPVAGRQALEHWMGQICTAGAPGESDAKRQSGPGACASQAPRAAHDQGAREHLRRSGERRVSPATATLATHCQNARRAGQALRRRSTVWSSVQMSSSCSGSARAVPETRGVAWRCEHKRQRRTRAEDDKADRACERESGTERVCCCWAVGAMCGAGRTRADERVLTASESQSRPVPLGDSRRCASIISSNSPRGVERRCRT
ncbi:hypothetical protein OH77DRAFT_356369 [Trametes cingulata]|nr:hypothetical protein OH77DRAFT_356369 [Trametes cingulata]